MRRLLCLTLYLSAGPGAATAREQCRPPRADEEVLLAVVPSDPALAPAAPRVERALAAALRGRCLPLGGELGRQVLDGEGGRTEREAALVDARVQIGRAEDRFRELDDEEALALLASATTRLTAAHFEPGGVGLLARAHLIAGAIYLARGRSEAARQRLQRALDLEPDLTPPRDRFAPEVLAELAAVRAQQATRPAGRLVVKSAVAGARVFVDGRERGPTPLLLEALSVGNHLIRVFAPGRKSFVSTIQLGPADEQALEVELEPDEELRAIAEIGARARARLPLGESLAHLSRRSGGRRVLLAVVHLSRALGPAGTATVAVELHTAQAAPGYAADLRPTTLAAALERAFDCERAREAPPEQARAFDLDRVRPSPLAAVPEPAPFWHAPWFWGLAAVVALAASGGLALARASSGPPDGVEITLIPRP